MEEVRGGFADDPDDPTAPLFPSERIPTAVSALNIAGPGIAVTPSTFRHALKAAGRRFLSGPVQELHPPAEARCGDPQLRARDVVVGGAEAARS
jgi:hypothetical protein